MTTAHNNKIEPQHLTLDTFYEISKFIEDFKDYVNFAQINKYFYENLLLNENNIALNEIFKRNEIILTENLPNYLFKIKTLNIRGGDKNNNFNLLQKFINLKSLHITSLEDDFILNNLPNLEELFIYFSFLQEINLSHLKNLTVLHFLCCNVVDSSLQNLNQLTELRIENCKLIYGNCLLNLNNLQKLFIEGTEIKDDKLKNLQNLKELNISYCKHITGECLQNLTNLEITHINNTSVKEEYLENLINLKELYANYCYNLTLGQFLLNLNKLKALSLGAELLFENEKLRELKSKIKNGEKLKNLYY